MDSETRRAASAQVITLAALRSPVLIVGIFWGDYLVGHESPLHKAVSVCDFARVEKLLKEGVDPNDCQRRPPLCFASGCQPPLKMERMLLEAGADPDPVLDPGTPRERGFLDQLKRAPRSDPEKIRLLESTLEKRTTQGREKTD